jgi:4-amino-4-deoxy-L-arabinose transferase-like glycosyltransferase
MNGASLEAFYGAAARSMSSSWHNFFFGAFDPAGTVTLDKLPGALWPQALSLRIFGFHIWALVLPQVIEGVLTVLVLYRAVRRLAGPIAGIVAAAALASSPVTVALNRGNVADSLLILLAVLWAFFSAGGYPNSYYVAALSPAIGALCGAGVALAWRHRGQRAAPASLTAALLCCVGYGLYLLRGGTAVPGWLAPAALALGVVGALALWLPRRPGGSLAAPTRAAVALAIACSLLLPSVAAALMAIRGLGPFAAPYEPASATISRSAARRTRILDEQVIQQLSETYETPIALAVDSSILAAPFILATGREVLPIGGFQGGIPAPSLSQLRRYIATDAVRAFLVPVHSSDPRVVWIHKHCSTPSEARSSADSPTALYDCTTG